MIRSTTFLAVSLVAVSLVALSACTAEAPKPVSAAEPAPAAKAAAWKKIAPSANYALKTCVVSGDPLDAMEGRLAIEYAGREVQFCCDHCVGAFEKDPAKYLAMLDAAKK